MELVEWNAVFVVLFGIEVLLGAWEVGILWAFRRWVGWGRVLPLLFGSAVMRKKYVIVKSS